MRETYWGRTGEIQGLYQTERGIWDAPLIDNPSQFYGPWSIYEPFRQFIFAGYQWIGWVVPRPSLLPVALMAQVEDHYQAPPGTYVLGFSAASAQSAGFRFSLYDAARKRSILVGDWPLAVLGAEDTADTDAQMHALPEPALVLPPGLLQAKVSNLASVSNDMQLVIHLVVPVRQEQQPMKGSK